MSAETVTLSRFLMRWTLRSNKISVLSLYFCVISTNSCTDLAILFNDHWMLISIYLDDEMILLYDRQGFKISYRRLICCVISHGFLTFFLTIIGKPQWPMVRFKGTLSTVGYLF
uniref:Uncharacterized protein n=1 Tax=Spongospora subterranea TaxID=70186 RepID=A0A0H5RFV8_9EUKA|eukprot:CRZ07539.1 hypothetical protein [Spongospora subterranea]